MIKQHPGNKQLYPSGIKRAESRRVEKDTPFNDIPKTAEIFYQTKQMLHQKLPQKNHHMIIKSIPQENITIINISQTQSN